jgi:hypothetical protein
MKKLPIEYIKKENAKIPHVTNVFPKPLTVTICFKAIYEVVSWTQPQPIGNIKNLSVNNLKERILLASYSFL